MATRKSLLGAENASELLACQVCLENFDDSSHQPKLLPCHHSFCKACLEQIISNQNTLICPSCRQRTQLPPGGIQNLQANFYVTQLKDLLQNGSSVPLQKQKTCHKHLNQPKTLFCATCEITICHGCIKTEHSRAAGHVVRDVEEAMEDVRHEIQIELGQIQNVVLENKLQIQHMESEIHNLYIAKEVTSKDIEKTFAKFIEALHVRRQQLRNHLQELYRYKREVLLKETEQLKSQSTSLLGMVEECEEVIDDGSISDLLAYKAKIVGRNQELQESSRKLNPGNNFVKFDPEENRARIVDMVQDIGALCTKEPLPSVVNFETVNAVAGHVVKSSIQLKSCSGQELKDYPIDIEVFDHYDEPCKCIVKNKDAGKYTFTFRPAISGTHHIKVKFLGHVIQGGEHSIQVASNNPIVRIGTQGKGEGDMIYPRAVAVDRADNIYVVDTGNNRIQKFTKMGEFLAEFYIDPQSSGCSSCGIAIDLAQNLIICPEVLVQAADLTDACAVLVFSMDGQLCHRLVHQGILKQGLSLAVNSRSEIIVADYALNMLAVFNKMGRLIVQIGGPGEGPGQFNHPTFVCIGPQDRIIVADGDNHRIQVFDSQCQFLYSFGTRGSGKGHIQRPFGVTTDKYGNILVVDGGNKRIQIYKSNGEFISSIESLADRMNAPRGIAVTSDGHVIVADRDNHCVKKYKYLP